MHKNKKKHIFGRPWGLIFLHVSRHSILETTYLILKLFFMSIFAHKYVHNFFKLLHLFSVFVLVCRLNISCLNPSIIKLANINPLKLNLWPFNTATLLGIQEWFEIIY